jgi:hypothetical protein
VHETMRGEMPDPLVLSLRLPTLLRLLA